MTWPKQRWKSVETSKLLWIFLWRQNRSTGSYCRGVFLMENSCFLKRWSSVIPQHRKKLRASQVVMLGSCWAVLGGRGVPECWGQSSHSSAPSLCIRSGVTFLAPALTQLSAHSYQQDLQVALRVCPVGIEIFLNSEHPWPFSSYASLSRWTIDWYIYV